MKHTIPDSDITALERRAAVDREYREAIENGTDPYISKWFDYSLAGFGLLIFLLVVIDVISWTLYS